MSSRLLLLLWGLMVSMVLTANPVTRDAARQKALLFLREKSGDVANARGTRRVNIQLKDGADMERLHIFNVGQDDGFVIISGDDCTGDLVLGYADEGSISLDNMPENMRAWLQGYADQIQWMQEHGIQEKPSAARRSQAALRSYISPLLTCAWNQSEPYNNNCPDVLTKNGGEDVVVRAAAGCLATAAAQVMYWHQKKYGEETGQWTTTTDSIPAYETTFYPIVTWTDETHTSYTTGDTVGAKAPTTIDWSKLVDYYPSTEESNAEVAKLMEYVGAGLQMGYGPESNAFFAYFAPMLINYFGYNKSARFVERAYYSYDDWMTLMYDQIKHVGPVFYGGQSTGGGHAFVLDGYDEEDYFHVNWGWGGSSNGFFKLSVLYSRQQGIGGSKSQDGYNYQQNATIDVNPDKTIGDENVLVRLTTNRIWVDATEYHRTSDSENFEIKKPYYVHFEIFNLTGSTQSIDFGMGLYKDEKLIQVFELATQTIPNYNGWNDAWCSLAFGAGLADGVYQLVPISRKHNTETWYKNFRSEANYIEAVIRRATLTLTPMGKADLRASLAVSTDNPSVGQPVTVTATVINNGPAYSGDLMLCSDNGTPNDGNDDFVLCAQQVEIGRESTCDVDFTFIPQSTSFTAYLVNNRWSPLQDASHPTEKAGMVLNLEPSPMTTGKLGFDFKTAYTLNEGSFAAGIYGPTVSGSVTVTNTSDVDHTSGINIKIFEIIDNYTTEFIDQQTSYEIIEKNSSKAIPFKFDGLRPGGKYFFNVFYQVNGEFINYSYYFYSNYGVTTYTADGRLTVQPPMKAVVVPDSVVVLDVSKVEEVAAVTPNANPNTLYIVGSVVPSGLEGKNVVQDGIAASLTLRDGYDFYPTVDFTVAEAPSFTRKFALEGDGTNGWTTIVLPFDVKQVNKDFRVMNFVSEGDGVVTFAPADEMKANTPYLIAIPAHLANQDITFYGEANAEILADRKASVSGKRYKFTGSTCSEAVTNQYVMNDNGSVFEKATTTVPAFQAYFKSWKMDDESASQLIIDFEDEPTAISLPVVPSPSGLNSLYNLNGQRVQQPKKGIYIRDGKKIVIR